MLISQFRIGRCLELMESVSPYSPTSSLHDDMVVPYPSLPIMTRPESIGRYPLSGNEAVVIRKNQTGSTKYDERDDAVAPGENSNDRGRSLHGNTNPLLQKSLVLSEVKSFHVQTVGILP